MTVLLSVALILMAALFVVIAVVITSIVAKISSLTELVLRLALGEDVAPTGPDRDRIVAQLQDLDRRRGHTPRIRYGTTERPSTEEKPW